MTPITLDVRSVVRNTIGAALLIAVTAAPGLAQRRARVSADLADHLATGSQSIDVIVHGDQATVDGLAARYNVVVKRRMKSGGVLHVNAGQLDALQGDPDIDHLSGDVPLRPSMAITNVAIGADRVWAGQGIDRAGEGRDDDSRRLTGEGITVAVIDSGIDDRHQALKHRVIAAVDFTGGDGMDRYGHGTHVAAIIAGQAGRTLDTRELQGVAHGAYLVNLRVLGDDGSGVASSVIEAIDWAIEHRRQYHIGVINLSLGGPVLQPYADDPMCEAVERAVRAGIVVVTAAGNLGSTQDGKIVYGGITSPGNDPYVLTVGALDTHGTSERSDDTVATYSSHGPTRYDHIIKPDLVAPGSHIVSAEVVGSYISNAAPQLHVTGTGNRAYIKLSGTSMATGVVSGTVALLLEERPTLTPADVKAVVQLTSSNMSSGWLTSGAGSLNALAAATFVSHDFARPPIVSISGERVSPGGLTTSLGPSSIVRSNSDAIIWSSQALWGSSIIRSSSDAIIWSSSDAIIWSSADAIIWSSSDAIIWSSSDAIIWSSSDAIIWSSSDAIIWSS